MVLNYHHRLASSDPMPQWVQTLFLQWIPWALRISRPGAKITRKSIRLQNKVLNVILLILCIHTSKSIAYIYAHQIEYVKL